MTNVHLAIVCVTGLGCSAAAFAQPTTFRESALARGVNYETIEIGQIGCGIMLADLDNDLDLVLQPLDLFEAHHQPDDVSQTGQIKLSHQYDSCCTFDRRHVNGAVRFRKVHDAFSRPITFRRLSSVIASVS